MANLKDIKLRITSVQKTQQITKAMKMVAASKMKQAYNAILSARLFFEQIERITRYLLDDENERMLNHFIISRDVRVELLLVVASDKGLCGGFNSNIRKAVEKKIESNQSHDIETKLIVVGRKSLEFCTKFEVEIISFYTADIHKNASDSETRDILSQVISLFESGRVDRVTVFFNRFVNAITQLVEEKRVLPVLLDEDVDDNDEKKANYTEYLYEPPKEKVLSYLLPKYLSCIVQSALLESKASEQAARMLAMDNATNNAGEMIKKLRQQYNRIRQASITTEISEIVSGAAALHN